SWAAWASGRCATCPPRPISRSPRRRRCRHPPPGREARMDEAALAARFDELCRAVLSPLVLGGEVHPVRPIGADLGLLLGKGRLLENVAEPEARPGVPAENLASSISVARVRRA